MQIMREITNFRETNFFGNDNARLLRKSREFLIEALVFLLLRLIL